MDTAMPLCILGLLLVTGAAGIASPEFLWELDTENRGAGPPTPTQLRQVRITCVIMIVLAAIGLYCVLTDNGEKTGIGEKTGTSPILLSNST
jgi:hypothetical protein